MIGPHVTVNPLIFMAVVTVLISGRLYCGIFGLPEFVSADPFAVQLCVSPLGALPFSLMYLTIGFATAGLPYIIDKNHI